MRLFVAVELHADVNAQLSRALEALRPCHGYRWVKCVQLHVTCKFLGEVDAARVVLPRGDLAVALRAIEVPALQLGVRGLGQFPPRGRPRVVWAGLSGDVAALEALAERVDRACAALDFPREDRPFRAHVTLARVNDDARPGPLPAVSLEAAPQPIDGLHLIHSTLTPQGSVYRRVPLG